MITYIRGKLTEKKPTHVVVETSGVGYVLYVSLQTYTDLQEMEEGAVLVHYSVSVDIRSGESKHQLFGFSTEFERQMFRLLISVSGISSSIARMILSSFKATELQMVILTGDVKSLTAVKGIGPKVAQKIIHELREKVGKEDQIMDEAPSGGNTMRQEALSALTALGFDRASSVKVINNLLKADQAPANVETLIKQALKLL